MLRFFILTLLFIVSASFINKGADTFSDKFIDKTLKQFNKTKNANYYKLQIPDSINYTKGNFYVLKNNENKVKYIYKGKVNTCRAGGCSIENTNNLIESSEYFRYVVLFNKKKEIVFINIIVVYLIRTTFILT